MDPLTISVGLAHLAGSLGERIAELSLVNVSEPRIKEPLERAISDLKRARQAARAASYRVTR